MILLPGFVVSQRKLEMLRKETKKLEEKERRREAARQAAVELQAGVEGQREHCKHVALDARELEFNMGQNYERELELAAAAAKSCGRSKQIAATLERLLQKVLLWTWSRQRRMPAAAHQNQPRNLS